MHLVGFNAKQVPPAAHFTQVLLNFMYPVIQDNAVYLSVHVLVPVPHGFVD